MAGFRLQLDATRCDGHGICVLACPELVRLDPWGYASVTSDEQRSDRSMRRARRAAAKCPSKALRVERVG